MVFTGEDYANGRMQDFGTGAGLRLAMFDAVKEWKALPADQQTSEAARELALQACRNNEFLQAAGTTELAVRYYDDILSRQESPDNVVNFLNEIGKQDIEKLEATLKQNDDAALLTAATVFSKTSREHLGIETLAESFDQFLYENRANLKDVEIVPQAYTPEQISMLEIFENKFRNADALDNTVYEITPDTVLGFLQKQFGVGYPAVAGMISQFDPKKETLLAPVIEAANRLRDGTSADVRSDLQIMQNGFQLIAGTATENPADVSQVTAEQAQKIADETLCNIQQARLFVDECNSPDKLLRQFDDAVRDASTRSDTLELSYIRAALAQSGVTLDDMSGYAAGSAAGGPQKSSHYLS
jgi:hypothetical protein